MPVNAPSFMTTGSASPSSSSAHGQVAWSYSPYQSVTATGAMPKASTKSWSLKPSVTTLSGASLSSVVP